MVNFGLLTTKFISRSFFSGLREVLPGDMDMLRTDDPEEIWMTLGGWSACSTGYIGAELRMYSHVVFVSMHLVGQRVE